MILKNLARGMLVFTLTALVGGGLWAAEAGGKLVFEIKNYESEHRLKKKVRKQLDSAEFLWDIIDDQLILSHVEQMHVKPRLSHRSTFGQKAEIELPAGEYRITCIGYIPVVESTDPDENFVASTFVNKDVMSFAVHPGQSTRLELHPLIKRLKQKVNWLVKLQLFYPEIRAMLFEDGVSSREMIINDRVDTSVPWDEYTGPLKKILD